MTKIFLLSLALLLVGCSPTAERYWAQDARDDATCKKSFRAGTQQYWNCRSQLAQLHAQQRQRPAANAGMIADGVPKAAGLLDVFQ